MNIQDIDMLIGQYQEELNRLQPTLHPKGGNLPYSKIGILNLARRKEKKYSNNLTALKLIRRNPEQITDDILKAFLNE